LPQNLHDGMDASIEAEVLARPFLHSESQSPFWPVVAAERSAMLQGDVPLFSTTPTSEVLDIGSGQSVAGLFAQSSFESMRKHLAGLNSSDLELQIQYIRSALSPNSLRSEVIERNQFSDKLDGIISEDDLIHEAIKIAEKIRATAISAGDGSVTWIARTYEPEAQVWQLQPMSFRLFDGTCGTALFLAALEQTTGGAGFRALALGALKMPSEASSFPKYRHLIFERAIGAGMGISSVVYALARAGGLLGEARLIEGAERTAQLITQERIAADRHYDLMSGAAGCLLALVALHKMQPRDWLLEKALQCGEHLLNSRSVSDSRFRSWKTVQGRLLTGFSHGAAGIAYALSLLSQKAGEKRFFDAAVEAVEYENSLFSEQVGNWIDLLSPMKGGGFTVSNRWCHGAPGIGLGRLGSPAASDGTTLRRDIDRAVKATERELLSELDHPCCGNLGRVELLLEAGRRLGYKTEERRARELASKVVRRARKRGHFLVGPETGIYMPSFHQGMAGVGYQLLRLARPDELPSVLLWE
jgi:type 2 lantibiotic biosynthesis protein LanM